jgi:hypothetical protein
MDLLSLACLQSTQLWEQVLSWLRLLITSLARLAVMDSWSRRGSESSPDGLLDSRSKLHSEILDRLGLAGRLDWSRASVDHVGANPVDRGKPGSKIHLICDAGLPLTAVVTAANVADVTMLAAVVDDIPPVRTPSGRRRTRPDKLDADKGFDSKANRAYLRRRRIIARIARRGIESSTRLGRQRWRVERSLLWLSCYRRLAILWDRGSERFFAFVLLACALVCFNRL